MDKRADCTATSRLHLLGHKYTMYLALFPGTKSPLYLDCLWVSFLTEKQTGLMSPMSLLPAPSCVPTTRKAHFSFLIL